MSAPHMPKIGLATFIVAMLMVAVVVAPCSAQDFTSDLSKRIVSATTERQCKSGENCANPEVIADSDAVRVLVRHGTPSDTRMSVSKLKGYLNSLPMSVWPKGPSIFIMQSDVIDGIDSVKVTARNGELARKYCIELGLLVNLGLGIWEHEPLAPSGKAM